MLKLLWEEEITKKIAIKYSFENVLSDIDNMNTEINQRIKQYEIMSRKSRIAAESIISD